MLEPDGTRQGYFPPRRVGFPNEFLDLVQGQGVEQGVAVLDGRIDHDKIGTGPGLKGRSTSVAENVTSRPRRDRTTSRIIHGKLAPREPSRTCLTSMMSAPPSAAAQASSGETGLTKTFIERFLLVLECRGY